MPKRTDLRSLLIVGSGPIRIGQACEFDYAGAQACRVLRREGYRVVLVNSNPATIMTDPEWADATYLEPLDVETVTEILERERPDALLPTLGGQTGLNLALGLSEAGVLDRLGVELVGADLDAIRRAEDRELFRETITARRPARPESVIVSSVAEAESFPVPAIVRPAFTLGGTGGGIAHTREELRAQVAAGLAASPIGQVLVERFLAGWAEHELEVMSDAAGNCVVVCSIENLDPMGVHTGDSWTVAPQQTLPDGEYQRLREAAFTCARAVGVATGGANVQFAYEPLSGDLRVIEMNPRVSRSSALASKATGFPIAKLAALLAVGYTLDELPNDITGQTTAAFEPALDYVAVKAPRFDFAKFPGVEPVLGSEMRAVGEALGIGRTFAEAFLKALQGRESALDVDLVRRGEPVAGRWESLLEAARQGLELPGVHPHWAEELREIAAAEQELAASGDVPAAKRFGLPDARIAELLGLHEAEVRERRERPGRLAVDSCAGEFDAQTPYYYLSYEPDDEPPAPTGRAVIVLGSGPNRIGQGIEFDYCCVHAAQALRKLGYEAVLVNSNPETVSTDYDTSDRLYLEPLTHERVLDVCELEEPLGVVVSLGGQTPLSSPTGCLPRACRCSATRSARSTSPRTAAASPRCWPSSACRRREWGVAENAREALVVAERIGYPVLVRPHHVLGGRGMRVVRGPEELDLDEPCLVDRYVEGALELDVDALCDGDGAWVAAVLEHVEPAGVHSGDSACVVPAPSVTPALEEEIRRITGAIAQALGARGLLNLQLALADGRSRCSRRTRARRGRCRSSRRRPACRSSSTRFDCCSASRWPISACPSASCRRARGRRRRSSRASASRAPPTARRRCARPAR